MYDHENMAKTLAKEASLENFALMQCERLATLLQCEQIQLFIKERETNDFMRFRLTKSGEPDISLIPVTTGVSTANVD
jgi:pyoverdine/dityrosine biosynthesis protein Dit1